jgi:cysteinyl-tRNA synthetase
MMFSIYDTKSRDLKQVQAADDVVHIYCCGPTVYRDAHVGNLRTFLLADLISRALRSQGNKVRLVQNITDVGHMNEDVAGEDKMLSQATNEAISPFKIAQKYEEHFHKDLKALNIQPADLYPRASETIDLIIKSISALIELKKAYVAPDGSVYFDAQSFPSYGDISGNRLESLKPGHRYEYTDDGDKHFHADWALWKSAGNRTQMVWDSPWGRGFPGWHIECTAMSLEYLDKHVDVHVGGIDLRFPHHENERAQSNSITGDEVVDLWVHGEHLLFEGRKMSKSAGNVVLLNDIISKGLDPLSLRLVLLENRYRSQMDLTWRSLEAADATLKRWRQLMNTWGSTSDTQPDQEFVDALNRDLDTPRALQRVRAIEKDTSMENSTRRAIFLGADLVLGLDLGRQLPVAALTPEQERLLSDRDVARKEKNWAESDRLRGILEGSGLDLKDNPHGQSWSWR